MVLATLSEFQPVIDLDESLIAFFGLYSGDGAKGTESQEAPGKVKVQISFSQREINLVKFAAEQFRSLFSDAIHFVFSLGEDSAYFMGGEGFESLKDLYGGDVPEAKTPKRGTSVSQRRRINATYQNVGPFPVPMKNIWRFTILTSRQWNQS